MPCRVCRTAACSAVPPEGADSPRDGQSVQPPVTIADSPLVAVRLGAAEISPPPAAMLLGSEDGVAPSPLECTAAASSRPAPRATGHGRGRGREQFRGRSQGHGRDQGRGRGHARGQGRGTKKAATDGAPVVPS